MPEVGAVIRRIEGATPDTPQPPSPTPPQPSHGVRNMLVWVVGIAMGIGWLGMQFAGSDEPPRDSSRSIYRDQITKVVIKASSGNVVISSPGFNAAAGPSGGTWINVSTLAGEEVANPPSLSDDGTSLTVHNFDGPQGLAVILPPDVEVEVDAVIGDVELSGAVPAAKVRTRNGNVDLRNIAAHRGSVEVQTAGGDVDLRDINVKRRAVKVKTTSGSVRGGVKAATALSVQTKSGETELDIGRDVGDVAISATSGGVDLALVSDTFDWKGTSSNGGLRQIKAGENAKAVNPGKVNTTSGDVDIRVG